MTLTDPKQADLQTALNSDADEVNFSANNGATAAAPGGLELNAPLTVPRDKTLNLTSGRLYNNSSLDVQGTLTVSQGAFLNNHDNGRITGTGTININGNDGLTNYSAGTVSFDGTINMNSGATVNNNGSMTINGSLNVSGGEVHNRNVFMVSGTANLTGVDWFNNYTGGTLTISGTMNVGADAVLNNDGGVVNVTSTSSLHIYGLMTNQGVLNVGTSGAPGAPGRVYVAGKGRLEYYRSTTSDGRNIVVNIARGSTLEITGELKISSALHFEVKPTGSFIITKDTAQNVQVEVAGSQWNVPLGSDGMYSYTNESSSEAGVSVTAASAPGGSAVVSTLNELETALGDTAGAATVTLSGSTPVSVSGSGSDLTVPTGKNLIIESGGTLEITNGGTLTVNGTVTVKVNGELYIGGITTPGTTAGTMTVNGTVTVEENGFLGNKGTVEVLSNSGLQINGTMDNYGTLQIGADGTRGRVDISSTGSFNGTGNITLYKDSTIRVAAETGLELSISRDGSDWTLEHNAGPAYSYTVAATAQVKLQRTYTVQSDF